MPARRRPNRARRQPPARKPLPQSAERTTGDDAADVQSAVAQPTTGRQATARTPARTRSRAPAQIVIANYDFLRHDLRLLAALAPTLIVVLIILSFVVH